MNERLVSQMATLRQDIQAREAEMCRRLNSLRLLEKSEKEKLTLALAKRDYELKGTRAALAHSQIQSDARAEALKRAQSSIESVKKRAILASKSVTLPSAPAERNTSARERLERRLALLPEDSPERANLREIITTMILIESEPSEANAVGTQPEIKRS